MRNTRPYRLLATRCLPLFPVAFVGLMWTMRTIAFPRYHRIVAEDGPLETLQFLFYLLAGLLSLWIARPCFTAKRRVAAAAWLTVGAGFLLVALEEISWGQRFLSRESSEYFLDHNIQGETNLHNLTTLQPFLHAGYIGVGIALVAVCLLSRSLAARHLILYFLPLVLFYGWFEFKRLAHDTYIYAYDQELAEFLLSLGLLIFVVQAFRRHPSSWFATALRG